MNDEDVVFNLGEVQMKRFEQLDFSNPAKVVKELSHITHLMEQGYQFPIEYLEKVLMKNGYNTFLDFEVNEKYKDIDLITYLYVNPDLDEVGRCFISLWMQQLLDYQNITFELQFLFDLYENYVKEVEEEQKQVLKKVR